MSKSIEQTNGEIGMPGAFFGGIMGGMVFGSAADILQAPQSSMLWYAVGVVVGAVGGTIAANIIAKLIR